MKRDKINNILKGAFAVGTVLGGSAVFSDMDVIYASELEEPDSADIVLPSDNEVSDYTDDSGEGEYSSDNDYKIGRAHV